MGIDQTSARGAHPAAERHPDRPRCSGGGAWDSPDRIGRSGAGRRLARAPCRAQRLRPPGELSAERTARGRLLYAALRQWEGARFLGLCSRATSSSSTTTRPPVAAACASCTPRGSSRSQEGARFNSILDACEQCVSDRLKANRLFTITGGTGAFAGAAGTGTVKHDLYEGLPASGTDTWSGSVAVPGLEFDLTSPVLSGLVNKTVRAPKGAKRVRVRYRVTARDLLDGSIRPGANPVRAADSRSGALWSNAPRRTPARTRRQAASESS